MKKTSMTLLTTAMLSLSSFLGADDSAVPSVQTENNGHRLYVGPEVFNSHHPKFFDGNNTVFGGLRFGYEYLMPNAFYVATDVVGALGKNRLHATNLNEKDPKFSKRVGEVFKGEKGHFWGNVEQRFGYTFSAHPSSTVSVYVGPGFHYEHVPNNHVLIGNHAHWWYGAAGVKAMQQLTDSFRFGADVKATLGFGAKKNGLTQMITQKFADKTFWGYEVGLPLEFKANEAFDVQVRPYLLKLNVDSSQTILGGTVALGYNF